MAATPQVKSTDLAPASAEPAKAEAPPVQVKTEEPAQAESPAPVDVGLSAAERAELEKLRADQTTRESAERRSLVTELVSLGAETPATAWSKDAPVARLSGEPLDDLRTRVAALRSVPRPSAVGHAAPPAGASQDAGTDLTPIQAHTASTIKDPAHRERFVARCRAQKERAANRK